MKREDEIEAVRSLLRAAEEPNQGAGAGAPPGTRWGEIWRGLELPPAAPAPPGFASRVAARARAEGGVRLGLPFAPGWARAVAALAIVAGVAGGLGLGLAEEASGEETLLAWGGSTLAEEFVSSDLDATAGVEGAER